MLLTRGWQLNTLADAYNWSLSGHYRERTTSTIGVEQLTGQKCVASQPTIYCLVNHTWSSCLIHTAPPNLVRSKTISYREFKEDDLGARSVSWTAIKVTSYTTVWRSRMGFSFKQWPSIFVHYCLTSKQGHDIMGSYFIFPYYYYFFKRHFSICHVRVWHESYNFVASHLKFLGSKTCT